MDAEGWYKDPFGAHEARWFSEGKPTILVRDGAVESHDSVPGIDFDLPLIPIIKPNADGSTDMMRADRSEPMGTPGDGAFQAFGASGGTFT
jgi:hypothetical protein